MGAAVGVGCVGAAAHAVAVRTANSRRVPKRLRRGLRRLGLRQATLLRQHNKGLAGATRTFQRKASELEASTAVAVESGLAGGPATVSLKAKARPGPAWEVAARAGGDNDRPLRAHWSVVASPGSFAPAPAAQLTQAQAAGLGDACDPGRGLPCGCGSVWYIASPVSRCAWLRIPSCVKAAAGW